jgi:hypothetical protein
MGQTTFSGPVRSLAGFNPVGFNSVVNVASGDNALTLTAADHGGRLITVEDTTMIFTVPEIVATEPTDKTDPGQLCNLGLTFRFLWLATGAGGTEINLSGSDEFIGPITVALENGALQTQFLAEADDNFASINMNATTTGGIIGSYVEITAVASARWIAAKSLLMGSGIASTPFATA